MLAGATESGKDEAPAGTRAAWAIGAALPVHGPVAGCQQDEGGRRKGLPPLPYRRPLHGVANGRGAPANRRARMKPQMGVVKRRGFRYSICRLA